MKHKEFLTYDINNFYWIQDYFNESPKKLEKMFSKVFEQSSILELLTDVTPLFFYCSFFFNLI